VLSFWSGREPVAASGLAQASVAALCTLRVVCAARYAGGIVGGLFDQCGMPADASRIGRRIALDRVLWPKEEKPEH
jgi:hypothetical protein